MNYLHLGKGWVVNTGEIMGIFDLDVTSQSHLTRKYLSMAEKAGQVFNASEDIPKSFVVCWDGKKELCISARWLRQHCCAGPRRGCCEMENSKCLKI